jgi:cytochrome b561
MTEPSDGSIFHETLESECFDHISIALHWTTALLIIVMFATAWSREAVAHDTRLASALMTAHRTTGVVTWVVGWVRLVWRINFAYLPSFPESMPKLQQWVAKANECGLYALLLLQPLSGLGNVLFSGRSFALFIWEIPALFAANPIIRSVFVKAHELGSEALLTLIGLHAGAALFHRLVLRDGVLQRMVPWTLANAPTRKDRSKLIAQHVKEITPQPAR